MLFFREIVLIYDKQNNFKCTKDYLGKIGIEIGKTGTIENVLWDIINILENGIKKKSIGTILQILKCMDRINYDDAFREVSDFCNRNKIKAIILIDSLDQIPIKSEIVNQALSGLLKNIGSHNIGNYLYDVRFCIPAELFSEINALSSNPLKDFEKKIVLHWHSIELLSIVAYRLQLYAMLYEYDVYRNIKSLSPNKRSEAKQIFYNFFPKKVINALGVEENTLAYIMRHTQLLPRQLIIYLNRILTHNKRIGENMANKVTNEAIVDGIKYTEGDIRSEIFSAFRVIYPQAREVYDRCISELPLIFKYGELQEVFTKFGKKPMEGGDFHDFKRMLIRLGCIGRVIRKTERYIEALFDYTRTSTLQISTEQEMCLHPIFSSRANSRCRDVTPKIIYPYGADLSSEDERAL